MKSAFRQVGLDIRLTKNVKELESLTWEQKQDEMWRPFLAHLDIRTVVDIGANTGQFAKLIHRVCPQARIISFEPLESCQAELREVIAGIPGSRIIQAAAGEASGIAEIFESKFSPCSSLLTGTLLLGEDHPDAARTEARTIEVIQVDNVLADEELKDDILVKFDVQGYEIRAIKGAAELLKRASLVVCEVSFFRQLYRGQPLFGELYEELKSHGFLYMGNAEQYCRKSDGRVVEADAIFEKFNAANQHDL